MILGIIDEIKTAFYSLMILIDVGVYSLLNGIYKIYVALAGARLLSNAMFTEIANRFYAVVGVAMLFVMAYVVIQGIINPDNFAKSGGEGSQLLKRIGIAVLGLALVPGAFRIAYRGQDVILNNNLIGKVFLGYNEEQNVIKHGDIKINGEEMKFDSDGDGEEDKGEINQNDAITSSAGTVAALSIWQAVFYPTDIDSQESMDKAAEDIKTKEPASKFIRGAKLLTTWGCGVAIAASIFTLGGALLSAAALCSSALALRAADDLSGKQISLKDAYSAAAGSGDFTVFMLFAESVTNGDITYRFPMSTILGLVAAYLFLNFAIDMAVRAVKLVYMQIIAPVPLMLQILPKFKDNLQKWLNTVLSLFMEVFIRLTFVYIVVYLISHLWSIMNGGWLDNANLNIGESFFAQAILIIGMLIFAKTAPQFISETLGISSGNLSLGIRKKLAEGGVLSVAAAAGGIGANLLAGGVRGWNRNKNKFKENSSAAKTAYFAGVGAVGGALGSAIKSAPRAIIDSKGVDEFRKVGYRIKDSYTQGKSRALKEEYERRQNEAEFKKDYKDKTGKDPYENSGGLLNFDTVGWTKDKAARIAYKVGKARETAARNWHDFGDIPIDDKLLKAKIEMQEAMEGLTKALQDTAAEINEGYKRAVNDREYLNSDEARRAIAYKMAKENGIEVDTPEKLQNYMLENHDAINNQLFTEKQAADKKVKEAKERAVTEEIQKEAIQGPGKMTAAINKKMQENADLFKEHGDAMFNIGPKDKNGNATPMKLRDYLEQNFGKDYESGIDIRTVAARMSKQEQNVSITATTEGGEITGVIKYRTGEGNNIETTFIGKDGKERPVTIMGDGTMILPSHAGADQVELTKVKMTKRTTLGAVTADLNDDSELKSTTISDMASSLGGTFKTSVKMSSGSGPDKIGTVEATVDGSDGVIGQITVGSLPAGDIKLGELVLGGFADSATVTSPINVEAKTASSTPISVSLAKDGATISAKIGDSMTIPVTGSSINLATATLGSKVNLKGALEQIIPTTTDGIVVQTYGGKTYEVQVAGGSLTSCKSIIATGNSFKAPSIQASLGTSPSFDIVGTAALMQNGETLVIRGNSGTEYTVQKKADGTISYSMKDNKGNSNPIDEATAKQATSKSAEVNVEELAKLAQRDHAKRLKIITDASTGETKEVSLVQDGSGNTTVNVVEEATDRTVEDIIKSLAPGKKQVFVLLDGRFEVTVEKKSSGDLEYTVKDTVNNTTKVYTETEFINEFELVIDSAKAIEAIPKTVGTETKIKLPGRDEVSISYVDAAELGRRTEGQVIVGGPQIYEAMKKIEGEGTISFKNGETIHIEPVYDEKGKPTTKRYYVYTDSSSTGGQRTFTDDDIATQPDVRDIIDRLFGAAGVTAEITGISVKNETEDKSESLVKELDRVVKTIKEEIVNSDDYKRAMKAPVKKPDSSSGSGSK